MYTVVTGMLIIYVYNSDYSMYIIYVYSSD